MRKITIESSKTFDSEQEANEYIQKKATEYINFCKITELDTMQKVSFERFKIYKGYKDLKWIEN